MRPYASRPGGSQPWEYLPAEGGVQYKVGMALKMEDGRLSPATGADKPQYLCMFEGQVAEAGNTIPVMMICEDQKLSADLSVDGKTLSVGDKVTISADGMDATATTGGALEILAINGTDVGDEIIVRVV